MTSSSPPSSSPSSSSSPRPGGKEWLDDRVESLFHKDEEILTTFRITGSLNSRISAGSGFVDEGVMTSGAHRGEAVRIKRVLNGVKRHEIMAGVCAEGLMTPSIYAWSHQLIVQQDVGSHTLSGYRKAVDDRAQALAGGIKAAFLSTQGKITSGILYKAAAQIELLHSRGIFHKDISSRNIVLKFPDGEGPLRVPAHQVLVFIVDFGESEISERVLRGEDISPGTEMVTHPSRVTAEYYDSWSLHAVIEWGLGKSDNRINGRLHDRFAIAAAMIKSFGGALGPQKTPKSNPPTMSKEAFEFVRLLTHPLATRRLGPGTDMEELPWFRIEAARLKAAENGDADTADEAEDAVRLEIEQEDDFPMPTIMSKQDIDRTVQARGGDLSDILAQGGSKRVEGRAALKRVSEPAASVRCVPLPPTTPAEAASDTKRRTEDEQQNVPPGRQEMSALRRKRKKTRGIAGGGDAQGAIFTASDACISPINPDAAQAYDMATPANESGDRQRHSEGDTISRRLRPRPVRGWLK